MILASSDHQQPSPISELTINDLPEAVLVDILCRVPDYRVVYQCKLVSKRWRTLLSDPYFLTRFLSIRHGQRKPHVYRYVMIPTDVEDHKTLVLNISSEANSLPRLEAQSISSILPPAIPKVDVHVEGTYNDLVLCTQGTSRQAVYYICNCYTKEWILRLPPAAPIFFSGVIATRTGFICNLPYYSFKEEAGASCNSSNKVVKLHAEYRFRVVRLFPFSVEIFSSETGKWRKYYFPSTLYDQRVTFQASNGIACNGKLYWLTYQDSVFELDPFNMCTTATASTTDDDHVITSWRFIELPVDSSFFLQWHIGVCRGRLHICRRFFHIHYDEPVVIWELKENEVMSSKPEWCLLHRISLSEMICKQPFSITFFSIVGFHPTDKDIVYLLHGDGYVSGRPRHVVMCNVREKSLEIALKIPSENTSAAVSWDAIQIFTSVIPWWPTPVPTGLNFLEEDLDITVDVFTLKVGSLSTVKQLKQELEKKRGRQLFDHELLQFDGRALDDDDKLVTDYGIKDSSNITLFENLKPYACSWSFTN